MNAAIILGTIGTIVTILGTIFHLQGQSVVGPESSFMYANPEWITYGIQGRGGRNWNYSNCNNSQNHQKMNLKNQQS